MAPYTHLYQLWLAAVCLVDIANGASGHVDIPFFKPELDLGQEGSRTLSDFVVPYLIQVQVGTPAQRVSLLISSSMTDTWVPDATSSFCDNQHSASLFGYDDDYNSDDVQKCVWGSFNASQSSTYKNANARYTDFDPPTFSGYALGINATDKLVISDLTVDNYPLGIVNSASSWIGVLGLGNNYSSSTTRAGYYATILDHMVSSGQISTPAYSIWLDSEEGLSGSILFGAVDKSRYSGDLLRLSALNPHAANDKFSASVYSINFTRPDEPGMQSTIISNDLPLDVTIGMGEIISFLPDDLASYMASLTGATLDTTANLYTIPCAAGSWSNATIFSFRLGGSAGPLLEVHTSDLIIKPGVFTGHLSDNLDPSDKQKLNLGLQDDDTCVFGIQTWDTASTLYSGEGFYASSSYRANKLYNLGNSFLRRSYMVFDVARWEIAVAPVVYKYLGLDQFSDVVDFADEYKAKTPESQYYCSVDFEDYCPEDSINCPGGGWYCDYDPDTGGGGSYGGDYYDGRLKFWRKLSMLLGTIFGFFVMIALVTAGFLCMRIIKKDRRTMGLPRDEEKRLMGDDGEGGGDATAGLESQQQPIMTGGAIGPLPVIREEEPSAAAQTQVPPADANREQRLSAPDMMGAPRSPSPLSDDSMGDARAEAASPVLVTEMDPKGKGKGVAEEIGQAR